MNDDDIERRLSAAFAQQARNAIPEDRPAPGLDLTRRSAPRGRRVGRVLAPLAVAAAVAAVAVGIALHESTPQHSRSAAGPGPGISTPATVAGSRTNVPVDAKPVHVSLQLSDNTQVGVGMPIIAYLSRPITDARAFEAATVVTVNGQKADGAWYFEKKVGLAGKPIEADYRLPKYWPAHSKIRVDLPVKGVSAGTGLVYDDDLTLNFATGAANVATVDDATHLMTLTSDNKPVGKYRVSLGAPNTPTSRGVKVIMEKGLSICMSGPGYNECNIKYTQRLTYGGEYLHAAPWNVRNIAQGIDSSNGCTNLTNGDAKTLYGTLEIGDVVSYPNANGPQMTLGDGYGDWNVNWATWLTGGLYPTH